MNEDADAIRSLARQRVVRMVLLRTIHTIRPCGLAMAGSIEVLSVVSFDQNCGSSDMICGYMSRADTPQATNGSEEFAPHAPTFREPSANDTVCSCLTWLDGYRRLTSSCKVQQSP